MENFREKLKIQNLVIAFGCAVLVAVSVLGATGVLKPAAANVHWADFWSGLIMGASCGMLGVFVALLVRNIIALHNEKFFKKIYVKENDERANQIWVYARNAGMRTFLILGMVAVVVAGYFSVVVSITILACLFANSLIGLGFVFYYQNKF